MHSIYCLSKWRSLRAPVTKEVLVKELKKSEIITLMQNKLLAGNNLKNILTFKDASKWRMPPKKPSSQAGAKKSHIVSKNTKF